MGGLDQVDQAQAIATYRLLRPRRASAFTASPPSTGRQRHLHDPIKATPTPACRGAGELGARKYLRETRRQSCPPATANAPPGPAPASSKSWRRPRRNAACPPLLCLPWLASAQAEESAQEIVADESTAQEKVTDLGRFEFAQKATLQGGGYGPEDGTLGNDRKGFYGLRLTSRPWPGIPRKAPGRAGRASPRLAELQPGPGQHPAAGKLRPSRSNTRRAARVHLRRNLLGDDPRFASPWAASFGDYWPVVGRQHRGPAPGLRRQLRPWLRRHRRAVPQPNSDISSLTPTSRTSPT